MLHVFSPTLSLSPSPPPPSTQTLTQSQPHTHLEEFFSQYTDFQYDSTQPTMSQFDNLCEDHKWKNGDNRKAQARQKLQNAIAQQFNAIYGSDLENVENWIHLCNILRITPVPDGLEACKEVSSAS